MAFTGRSKTLLAKLGPLQRVSNHVLHVQLRLWKKKKKKKAQKQLIHICMDGYIICSNPHILLTRLLCTIQYNTLQTVVVSSSSYSIIK